MGNEYNGTSLMQVLTDTALKQTSRRGFLGRFGKMGLALASAAAGISLATEEAWANNSIPAIDGYICPGPSDGACNPCNTACVNAGCRCSFNCSSGMFCFLNQCSKGKAHCSWQLVSGSCFFSCVLLPCVS